MRILIIVAAAFVALPALGFGGVYMLSEAKLRDVVRGPAFDHPIPEDAAAIEHGRRIARTRGCFGCHGQRLEGIDFSEQWGDWVERAVAPNLAAYAKAHDAASLEAAIRQGIGADGRALMSMPSYNFARLTDEDLAALIAFLKSAPVAENKLPTPKLGWSLRWRMIAGGETHMNDWAQLVPPLRVDAGAEPQRAHGEYLAMTMCNECHGLDLRGQALFEGDYTPDLAIVAAYPRDADHHRRRHGRARDRVDVAGRARPFSRTDGGGDGRSLSVPAVPRRRARSGKRLLAHPAAIVRDFGALNASRKKCAFPLDPRLYNVYTTYSHRFGIVSAAP